MNESVETTSPATTPVRDLSAYDVEQLALDLPKGPTQAEFDEVTSRLPESLDEFIALTNLLPETDEVPLESPWHLAAISLLIEVLTYFWRDRQDFFVGGNMFVYFNTSRLRSEDFRGPDFFYVSGVDRNRPRRSWVVWNEDKYPDLIIELTSPSTARTDRGPKKDLYEQRFRTWEYFIFDPDTNRLEGWRLSDSDQRYHDIPTNERGWMWSNVLQLWLGTWEGDRMGVTNRLWPRFYDAQGQLVLLQAETESQRAEAEHRRAQAEHQRAEAEHQRAEAERQRAEAAEAELARLRALAADKGNLT
jgi:Uma2 family endonuclease